MTADADFNDIEFCKRLVKRIIDEKRIDLARNLIQRISSVFVFAPKEFREELINCWYSAITSWPFKDIFQVCKESILGNVVIIIYLITKVNIITTDKLDLIASLLDLTQIQDPIVFEYVSVPGELILDLNEAAKTVTNVQLLRRLHKFVNFSLWVVN